MEEKNSDETIHIYKAETEKLSHASTFPSDTQKRGGLIFEEIDGLLLDWACV